MTWLEALLWSVLALLALLGSMKWLGPGASEDSFQYLSTARHIAAGEGIETSLVHWDSERAHGRIPAPMTHFPPGYPLAIAALGKLGTPYEAAGLACSIGAAAGLIALMAACAGWMGLGAGVTRGLLCLMIFNSFALRYGTSILSEALFALVSLGSLSAVIKSEEQTLYGKCASRRLLLLSGMLAGMAYWVRYAGVFLICALAMFHLIWSFRADRGTKISRVLAIGVSLATIAPVMLRNVIVAGTWTGGATGVATRPALHSLIASLLHLAVGWNKAGWGPGEVLLTAGLAVMVGVLVAALRNWRAAEVRPAALLTLILLSIYAGTNTAGAIYLWLSGGVDLETRYFYPLIPAFALLLGTGYQLVSGLVRRRLQQVLAFGGVLTLAGYTAVHAASVRQPPVQGGVALESRLSEEVERELTASAWIQAHIPKQATVAAACGQTLGYVLDRKTLSLIGPQYSRLAWDEAGTRGMMERFQADWLILVPDCPCDEASDWPYLRALAAGTASEGMRLAARTRGMVIWQRERGSAQDPAAPEPAAAAGGGRL